MPYRASANHAHPHQSRPAYSGAVGLAGLSGDSLGLPLPPCGCSRIELALSIGWVGLGRWRMGKWGCGGGVQGL